MVGRISERKKYNNKNKKTTSKSYLTHAILPRMSSMSSCEIASWRIQGLLVACFKINENSGEQVKESIIHVRVG